MPKNRITFQDLPILNELGDELSRAFTAHETAVIAPPPPEGQALRARLIARARLLRRPIPLIASGAALAVAATAAVVLATPGPQPAYALTQNADGSVTVAIHDVETAIPALNARFAALGIHETIVPVEANCPSSNAPSVFEDPMFTYPQATTNETFTFSPDQKYPEPGYTGVIAAEPLPNGEVAILMETIKPPVPSCFPTTVYTMQQTGTTANGVPIYQATPVDPATTTTTSTAGS